MVKKWLMSKLVSLLVGAIALGVGIWYLSHSIGGASLSYTNVDLFLHQIGVDNGDISNANGCFLCFYIGELFGVLGRSTELFWNGIVHNLWILMAVGFGLFIIFHTISFFREQATSKDIKDLSGQEPKLDFKKWFEKVWKTGVRVIVAGIFIGALNWSGPSALKTTTNIIVTPVMYIGSQLSMMATGVISNAKCDIDMMGEKETDVLTPVLKPFMCVMGNLNTVMLAGAGGGFALMNYAWLDLDGETGGFFTWASGLALVIIFLIIGFNLFFDVLNVMFKLIFIIVFMPLLIAAAAFEQVWSLAKNIMNSSITMLINSAISIIKISLKICIIYAIVYFAADKYYPGPEDGFTSVLPPLLGQITPQNQDAQTMSVINVFQTCEKVSVVDGEMDKDKFTQCFKARRATVEMKYPGAFDFMNNGFEFLLFMIGIAVLYFWVVSPEVDKLLNSSKEGKEQFNYADWVKDAGKKIYETPGKMFNAVRDKLKG